MIDPSIDPPSSSSHHRDLIGRAREQVIAARIRSGSAASGSHGGSSAAGDDRSPSLRDGLIDGYRILGVVHRGGQGEVLRAVQVSTGRTVAIKVLARGILSTRRERLRFEREAEILASLSAPGIVRIIDSGVADGHWWFSMDFVDGVALDEFARRELAAPRDRPRLLALMATVAEAVNAAHLHGIVHRDLKPRNILVDSQGRPCVVDFGLARIDRTGAAGAEGADAATAPSVASAESLSMADGDGFIGSLPWAAPEQVPGSSLPIDVRTDVYALGVILHQLLTGRFPYPVMGPLHQVARTIAETDPEPPSRVDRSIGDELETIVLTCLQKDPTRRYQSAGALAADLRRLLAGEPLLARRDSLAYLGRVWLRKHRLSAGVALVFVLTVAAFAVAASILWRQAALDRDRAVDAEREQQRATLRAESELRKANEVNRFLHGAIGAADPGQTGESALTMREFVETVRRQLDAGHLASQPEVEAAARESIATVLAALGAFPDAEAEARRALDWRLRELGEFHRDSGSSMRQLADVLGRLGRRAEAQDLAERAVEVMRRVHGDADHEDVVEALRTLAWRKVGSGDLGGAQQAMQQALAMRERLSGPDTVAMLRIQLDAAILSHGGLGSRDAVRRCLDGLQAALGPQHPDVTAAHKMMGGMLAMSGDLDGAEREYTEALESTRAVYGDAHPLTIEAITTLCSVAMQRGDFHAAIRTMAESRDHAAQAFGEHGFGFAQFLVVLGGMRFQAQAFDDAEADLVRSLEILHRRGVIHDPNRAKALATLAAIRFRHGEIDSALELASECLAIDRERLTRALWTRALASLVMGRVMLAQERYDEAEQALGDAVSGFRSQGAWAAPFREDAAEAQAELQANRDQARSP